jgi:hypothetical protein
VIAPSRKFAATIPPTRYRAVSFDAKTLQFSEETLAASGAHGAAHDLRSGDEIDLVRDRQQHLGATPRSGSIDKQAFSSGSSSWMTRLLSWFPFGLGSMRARWTIDLHLSRWPNLENQAGAFRWLDGLDAPQRKQHVVLP